MREIIWTIRKHASNCQHFKNEKCYILYVHIWKTMSFLHGCAVERAHLLFKIINHKYKTLEATSKHNNFDAHKKKITQ